ncbi:MAG: ThuA domain-containing protein [Devosia sp.]
MRKLLIVWGGWPWHFPGDGARIVSEMLAEDGFSATITQDFAALGDAAKYDLVVPIITNADIADSVVADLNSAVRGGVGLGGYHCCLAASFHASVPFHYLCGVQWVAHPGNETAEYRVNVTRPDDPVMEGIPDFDYKSEQYYLHYDPTVEVLATTTFTGRYDPTTAGVVMPVVFKRRLGAGRIFYSSLGHHPSELTHPHGRAILRRGLNWAARDPSTN